MDGSQTITFEFIVDKHKVDEHIAKLRSKPDDDTKKKKKGKNIDAESDDEAADTCVGHALWEDEDKVKKRANTKLGLKMKKETRMGRKLDGEGGWSGALGCGGGEWVGWMRVNLQVLLLKSKGPVGKRFDP